MKYYVGQNDSFIKKVNEEDVIAFAKVSGDYNSVHVDKQKAETSIFGRQVAHGMYTASLISKVIGMQLPGEGTIYISQNCKFIKPVFINDELKVYVEIISIGEKNRASLATKVFNQNEELVLNGVAEVLLPKEGK